MKKIILASVAATALIAGIGAAGAADPGEDVYFHERGNLDASMQLRGPAPDDAGFYQNGYQPSRGYQQGGLLGFAPFFDTDYDE